MRQDRPAKRLAICLFGSGEIPSPRQTSIDTNNDYVMQSKRRALVWGLRPALGLPCIHTTAGGMRRAPAWRLIKTTWPLVSRKQSTKNLNNNRSLPRRQMHMVFPRLPSTFTGRVRHIPDWSWVDLVSRSKVCSLWSCELVCHLNVLTSFNVK